MDFSAISNIVKNVESGDQQKNEEVYAFLNEVEKTQEAGNALVEAISSKLLTDNQKFICLSIIKNYKFPLADPYALSPLLASPFQMIISTAAIIIANYVTEEEHIVPILSLPEECISGVILVILACSENGVLFAPMIDYLLAVFAETTNDEIKLQSAKAIAELASKVKKGHEGLSQFYREVMQTELDESTLPLIYALLDGACYCLPRNEAFSYLLAYFGSIGENCPIPYSDPSEVSLYTFAQNVSYELYYIMFIQESNLENDEEEEEPLEYDKQLLVRSCIMNCLIGEDKMELFSENIEEFLNDLDAEDSTRVNCVKILNEPSLVDIAVKECEEIWHESEIHEEAALYILNGILPSHHMYDIMVPIPDENPFCVGQYLKYIYTYEDDVSCSALDEALESENYVLLILAADALSRSEYCFPEETVSFVSKMFEIIGEFETDGFFYILSILQRLISSNPVIFAEDLESLLSTLNELLGHCALNYTLFEPLCKTFAALSNVEDFHVPIMDAMTQSIVELLSDETTVDCGYDMILSLFCKDTEIVSQEAFATVIPAFYHALQTFELDPSRGRVVMEILAYSVTCGDCEFPVAFLTELMNSEMSGMFFTYLGSIIFGLFTKIPLENYADLLKAIIAKLTRMQSTVIQQNILCAFSAIALANKEAIEGVLAAAEIELVTFLVMFCDSAESWIIISPFDQRLCIAGLLQFADVELPDDKNILKSAVTLLKHHCQAMEMLSNQRSIAFAANDQFYIQHEFAKISIKSFIERVFPNKESLPQEAIDVINECYESSQK